MAGDIVANTIGNAHDCGCSDRRTMLRGMAGSALGLTAMALPGAGFSRVPARGAIDVHHHFLPPLFEKVASERGVLNQAVKGLSITRSLEEMDRTGVATAMLSIPGPGASIGDPATARQIARDANEYAARMVADHKGRFGMFATLPLPDIDGALAEVAYALDILKADGLQMWTSYGDFWLGDPRLTPLLTELNRRKTIVFTHPTAPNCCTKLVPEAPLPMIEFGTDTTRTIASLVLSGTTSRFPDIRWIFCHAGGTMPFLQERFVFQAKQQSTTPQGAAKIPNGVIHELRRLYYDTAQSANPYALAPLIRLVPPTQLLMGSDYPYRTITENLEGLAGCGLFDAKGLDAIGRLNAMKLMPRLA